MTEEQMRERIVELENENRKLTENYETVNSQIKVKDDEITSLNSTVSELKQKNYDLFIQVSKPIDKEEETNTNTQSQSAMSLSDVATKLTGGN